MPRLIKDGAIVEDAQTDVLSLDEWLASEDKACAVQLEPGEAPLPLFDHLQAIPMIVINFPLFMDGRGFSYARELRERGFSGEMRATGNFIRDQLAYLARCGFNAFEMADESQLDAALSSLDDFSEYYQASADQALPLYRRRG
jgi:uncharacterized protein (DUF934 family)